MTEFELKPLHPEAVEAAQKKAQHYRLLNSPRLAESICRDILAVEPDNTDAKITLILCLTDQYTAGSSIGMAMELVEQLDSEFHRRYYAGIVHERKAIATLRAETAGGGSIAYDWLRRAMDHYEAADAAVPDENDDAVLRWNTCARIINTRRDVRPVDEVDRPTLLE